MNSSDKRTTGKQLITKGQRWMSTSEPELGLGTITSYANRRVDIVFVTHDTSRTFAIDTAPLQRIVFTPGNTIEDTNGKSYTITSTTDDPENGLITYICGKVKLREDELSDTISFSTPEQRLLAGIADEIQAFSLRYDMYEHRAAISASDIRGFTGGRIDLIPHQLYIAQKATERAEVRILLADETGLGKTIEACLIMHRLISTGQVTRGLILVPDALVHQWFVELLRRFNLLFRILTDDNFDEKDELSPFEEDPLWICSTAMIRRFPFIADQLNESIWDLLIVDEAHHITRNDKLFPLVEQLTNATPSVILLSATPEQFGRKGHFDRLHLLDPHRYRKMEDPAIESQRLQLISSCISTYQKTSENELSLETTLPLSPKLHKFIVERQQAADVETTVEVPKEMTISHLTDLFGAGRAYFRNTRRTIAGFPKRSATLYPLTPTASDKIEPHARWIAEFLKQHPRTKVLVITSTIESVNRIKEDIDKLTSVDIALFHEAMTLIQRDRQAAYFAEDHGARMLICSESGSEGRNFQFCSDLVLLNVPWNPELLEQRIGRLDRIGQKNTIKLHVPVIASSQEELLCRFYHEGIGAFEKNVPAAAVVFEAMEPRLRSLSGEKVEAPLPENDTIEKLISDTADDVAKKSKELFNHRDFLLEFASNNTEATDHLIAQILDESVEGRAERIMHRLFNFYGIKLEDAGSKRSALLTEYCTDQSFPLPRAERPVITYDRITACTYDNIEFLTIDHPMVLGSLDLFLSSPHGSTSFALWNDLTATELLLESIYIIECIAPPDLRLFRFFTAAPIRMVVNHHQELVTDRYPQYLLKQHLKNGPVNKLITQKPLIEGSFPKLLAASDKFIEACTAPIIAEARSKMEAAYTLAHERLVQLRAQGSPVTDEELGLLADERAEINNHLTNTRVRRDAIRLIWRGAVKGA